MHGSAHDKAQRRRGVLRRRGKCVQRALRGVITRLRTRRTLVATAALVLLVLALLTLCHARLLSQRRAHRDGAHDNATTDAVADDSTSHVAASPTDRWLLRPDTQHGGSVRVMLLIVSTRVDEPLCYALASAYFADLPVVVLGYGTRPFVNAMKPSLFLDAIQRAGLRDRDVVLLLDSDILFSGEDMLPFIDDYIARSPAAPSALDVRAVRAGTARAPSLYSAESFCFAFHSYSLTHQNCSKVYNYTDYKVAAYVARTGVAYDLHNASVQPLRYLNSGVSIHRVWSARELLRAYVQFVTKNKPLYDSKGWQDDQSVLALFYNDLRAWEVEHDVLRNNSTAAVAAQRGPHGLQVGSLSVDPSGRIASVVYLTGHGHNYLSCAAWRASESVHVDMLPFGDLNIHDYVRDAWRRYGDGARLQQRSLACVSNAMHTIELTPPLLYVAAQLDSALHKQPLTLVSPLIWHFTNWPKRARTRKTMRVLPWYVPMRYNSAKWQQARVRVLSTFIELWTETKKVKRVRYGDACELHHPFTVVPY